MKNLTLITAAIATTAALATGLGAWAQTAPSEPAQAPAQTRGYGSTLMTAQERADHRQQMRTLSTAAERDQVRSAQHARMVDRAKERGVTLPAMPPARGQGAGPRADTSAGMGAGPRSARGGGRGR